MVSFGGNKRVVIQTLERINWTELGDIKVINPKIARANIVEDMSVFMTPNGWDRDKLPEYLPEATTTRVIRTLKYATKSDLLDNSWWMKTSLGKFTIRNAWEEIRQQGWKIKDCDCI